MPTGTNFFLALIGSNLLLGVLLDATRSVFRIKKLRRVGKNDERACHKGWNWYVGAADISGSVGK
jgi:hypothetical protein